MKIFIVTKKQIIFILMLSFALDVLTIFDNPWWRESYIYSQEYHLKHYNAQNYNLLFNLIIQEFAWLILINGCIFSLFILMRMLKKLFKIVIKLKIFSSRTTMYSYIYIYLPIAFLFIIFSLFAIFASIFPHTIEVAVLIVMISIYTLTAIFLTKLIMELFTIIVKQCISSAKAIVYYNIFMPIIFILILCSLWILFIFLSPL